MPITGENCPLVAPCEQKPQKVVMNGKEVYKFVVTTMPESISNCLEKAGLTPDDVDYLIPHQANYRIIEAMASRLNYNEDKILSKIEKRILKILKKAEHSLPETVCRNNILDAFRYSVHHKYEYKDRFLGKERFSWEMIFLSLFCILVFGSFFVAWLISK